jgi:glucose-1-phosphate cytidylyltransferase
LRLKDQLKNEGTFFFTYGDGLSNVNLKKLLEFHKSHGRAVTVTAVHPTPRFGGLEIKENKVIHFKEKPQQGEGWINGGFFVMNSKVFDYLSDDATILERDPMEDLVKDGQLMAYEHPDFWQCMDTIRDRQLLEEHWESGEAPWKSWK